jgi:hypothetical protein
MQVTTSNLYECVVTGRICTADGQTLDVQVNVPTDGSLCDEEAQEAALIMLQQQFPGCRWHEGR